MNTTLPTGPNVISITPSQGTCSGTTSLTCTIGSLATNASATVNVIIKPTASGVYTTTATVESGEDDPVMTNNTVSESTTVSSPSDLARVNVARQGQGKVTSNPVGINCSTTCVSYFNPGTQVTLTATPDTGWEFIRWEGACSGTVPTCVITTNGDAHARSVFRRQ